MLKKLWPLWVVVALCAVLILTFYRPTATDTTEISFWEWYGGATGDFLQAESQLFMEQHPNIRVTITSMPDQRAYRESLSLAFAAGNSPDVFVRRGSFGELLDNGWIHAIDQWTTQTWREKFPEGSLATSMWDGRTYSFPFYATSYDRVLFINEGLFRAAGLTEDEGAITVPRTWSELRSMAKQITEVGQGDFYGLGIGTKDPRHLSFWLDLSSLAGTPGFHYDFRTGHYTFSSAPGYGRVIELLLGMKEDGSVYPYAGSLDDVGLCALFGQGKIAIFLSGSWSIMNLRRDYPSFEDYQVVSLPLPDDGRKGGLAITPGQGVFFMSSQTQHPDEAWLWLDWLASRECHERMVAGQINFSVYADINTPDSIADHHKAKAYDIITEFVVVAPFPPARNPSTARVMPKPVIPDIADVLVGIYTGQIDDWQQALVDLDARKQAAFEVAIQEINSAGFNVTIDDFIFPDWDPMRNYGPET